MDIEPEITQVCWGKVVNIGNFETVRLELTAKVNAEQDWREVLRAVRHIVRDYETAIKSKKPPTGSNSPSATI